MNMTSSIKAISKFLVVLSFAVLYIVSYKALYNTVTAMPLAELSHYEMAEEEVYRIVDEMPEIVGGIEKIYDHLRYPEQAVSEKIEGRVVVQFIVEANGSVRDPEVLRDIGGGCGEAAVAAIRQVEFRPGVQDGQNVPVIFAIPVTFQLD
ncbi:energy transducer TonB [Balneolaceae bacterium ANBcel3]|nr:energy transducer TonB [Balneolaceae bacterium ANBcel3]